MDVDKNWWKLFDLFFLESPHTGQRKLYKSAFTRLNFWSLEERRL